MKSSVRSKLQLLSLGALLLTACGGSSTTTGGSTAGGNTGDSGAAGSPSGGSPNGGSPNGGSPNGGSPNGGSPNGGSGAGAQNLCTTDADCTACAYLFAPRKLADCYCASCGDAALSKSGCAENQKAWQAVCSGTPRPCPAIACIQPRAPSCTRGVCSSGIR